MKKWSMWICGAVATLCLGGGVGVTAISSQTAGGVVAEAATTFETIDSLTPLENKGTAALIEAHPTDLSKKPTVNSWEHKFTFVEGTGEGVSLNGTPISCTIKQPNDFYIELGAAAQTGDVVFIDGTFYNADEDANFVFEGCSLRFNGENWESWDGFYIGKMVVEGGTETTLSIKPTKNISAGVEFEGPLMINGVSTSASMRGTNGIVTLAFEKVSVGDGVLVGGIYTDEDEKEYIVSRAFYRWDGSAWTSLEFAERISEAVVDTSDGADNHFVLTLNVPSGRQGWETMALESGAGIAVNGEKATNAKVQLISKNKLYVNIGRTVKVGDIVTIEGVFAYEGVKITFAPTQAFKWDGAAWARLSGATYALGEMSVASTSASVDPRATQLYMKSAAYPSLPVKEWNNHLFTVASGAGVMVNGKAITPTAIKSTGEGLFMDFAAVNVGDIVSIGGEFVCSSYEAGVRYVITDSYFLWNGTKWEVTDPYYAVTINELTIDDQTATGFYADLGVLTGVEEWVNVFTKESGKGILLNAGVSKGVIKLANTHIYVDLVDAANVGDIVTIEGVYSIVASGVTVKLTFATEQKLEWNGEAWVAPSTKTHFIGTMKPATPSSSASSATAKVIYLKTTSGVALPVQNWNDKFTLKGGAGMKVDGNPITPKEIKSAPEGYYISFDAVNPGAIVSIAGTYESNQGDRYVIEESKFHWNGSKWELAVDYTSYYVGIMKSLSHSSAGGLYLGRADGNAYPVLDNEGDTWSEKLTFIKGSGEGVTLDGQVVNGDIKAPGDVKCLYFALNATAKKGSKAVIEGVFYSNNMQVKYDIERTVLIYDGSKWNYSDEMFEKYDTVSLADIGWGLNKSGAGAIDGSGLRFTAGEGNVTNSVVFRGVFNTEDSSAGQWHIRLRGGAWEGFDFLIAWKNIYNYTCDSNALASFSNNEDYLIEVGAIDTVDGNWVYTYVKVDGVMKGYEMLPKSEYGSFNTNHISIYGADVAKTTWSDPDNIAIEYEGGEVEYMAKGAEYQLSSKATSSTFIGWMIDETFYEAGAWIDLGNESVYVDAYDVDFKLKAGASIRLASTADESGIRFTGLIGTAEFDALEGYGIEMTEYGTLIMPNDYLSSKQAPNLTDFTAGVTILKIVHTVYTEELTGEYAGYTAYYGAMKKLYTQNYGRNFAGRGYMMLTLPSGKQVTIYTPFSADNVRSVKYIAGKLQDDTEEYDALSDAKKGIVDTYAASPVWGEEVPAPAAVSVEEGYAAAYVLCTKKTYEAVAQRGEQV